MTTTDERVEGERGRVRITGYTAMQLESSTGQSLVRIDTDSGLYGLGEAGARGPVCRGHLEWIGAKVLKGADPLNVDKLYHQMVGLQHTYRGYGPTISGIDIALWDLAGKILNCSVSELMTGRFRDRVEMYFNGDPSDWSDRASIDDFVAQFREHPYGFRTLKCSFPIPDDARLARPFAGAEPNQSLKRSAHKTIERSVEMLRDSLGWDLDFITHCHNEWDVPTAIGICQAVEESMPVWIEDPLQVWSVEAYRGLRAASRVPVCTGEKIHGYREFFPFIVEGALDVLHPDLCWCGGISGGRKIAELADHFGLPVALHNCGTLVHNMANVHFGASVRNFSMTETRLYDRDYIAKMGGMDGFDIVDGMISVPDGPGLGIELDPEVLRAELLEGEPFWE